MEYTFAEWQAAEAAFRAYYEGTDACWNSLSDLGKAAWARAAKAATAPKDPNTGG